MEGSMRSKVLGACWVLLAAAGAARAQSTAQVNAGVQFNFSTPGARSLGLGGAFLGLADDATAAYANPAGLTAISRPEVSVEGRRWTYTHTFAERGRQVGAPSGIGVDTVAGVQMGEAETTLEGLSFLSAAYPRSRWTAALYRHRLANYEAAFRTQGIFTQPEQRIRPAISTFALDIVNVGLSFAYRFNDRLSVGVGVSSFDFVLRSRTDRYERSRPARTEPGGVFGPPLYTPENLVDSQLQQGDDQKTAFNAGFLWKVVDGWTVGGVYRQGPELDYKATYRVGPLAPDTARPATRRAIYDTPDVYGIGIATQPSEVTTITLDYVRIRYSDLVRSFTNILLLQAQEFSREELRNFKVDDAGEIHLGVERVFPLNWILLVARAGAWYDPDHRIRYEGIIPGFQAEFRRGDDEIHYSAGFGFLSTRLKLEADAAFDYSDPVKTASISAVVRF